MRQLFLREAPLSECARNVCKKGLSIQFFLHLVERLFRIIFGWFDPGERIVAPLDLQRDEEKKELPFFLDYPHEDNLYPSEFFL